MFGTQRTALVPLRTGPVHATFSCATTRNIYCVVNVAELGTDYAAYRHTLCKRVGDELVLCRHLPRTLADLAIAYLSTETPIRPLRSRATQAFTKEALDAVT